VPSSRYQPLNSRRGRGRAALLLAAVSVLLPACALQKDVVSTRQDIASVQGNLQGLESNIGKNVASLSEEIIELKRQTAALKSRDEELRQAILQAQQSMNMARIETDENFRRLKDLNREYQKSLETNLQGMTQTFNARSKDLETGLADLKHRLDENGAVDVDQNRRIGETVNRLNIFIEEAAAEHAKLAKGLADTGTSYNQLADTINNSNKELTGTLEEFRKQLTALREHVTALRENAKAAAAAPSSRYHVVEGGDTLKGIAAKYGLTVDDLVKLNNLPNPNAIKVGQKLILAPE
jgi:LysM repeat protein